MNNNYSEYLLDVTFINRKKELQFLKNFINKRSFEILFIQGPKSSGKTTLLYKFLEGLKEEKQKTDVKFLNLREKLTSNYSDFIRIFFGIDYSKSKEDIKEKKEYNLFNFFKLSIEVLKGMETGELDPFEIMKKEFIKLNDKGIRPIIIIDELQAINHIYLRNGKDRQVIIELFNFFVAMTKETHLAHIIVASSDGYFLNKVYSDSRLKQTSKFYKVNYLEKHDTMEWLLNLEKYSKIKKYTLTGAEAEQIWDTVGGSMWEIQDILSDRFEKPLTEVLELYKKKMKGIITHYIGTNENKEKILNIILKRDKSTLKDLVREGADINEAENLLQDMVKNNILYFDPTEALYSPQARSYYWGILHYFESQQTS
jgi:AAA+ ATPase superfamily predicted ATPase